MIEEMERDIRMKRNAVQDVMEVCHSCRFHFRD
jgi:hypothetical protein